MSDRTPTELSRAIGDLGPARRHVERLRSGAMPLTLMALEEISRSLERCVERLERLDQAGTEKLLP